MCYRIPFPFHCPYLHTVFSVPFCILSYFLVPLYFSFPILFYCFTLAFLAVLTFPMHLPICFLLSLLQSSHFPEKLVSSILPLQSIYLISFKVCSSVLTGDTVLHCKGEKQTPDSLKICSQQQGLVLLVWSHSASDLFGLSEGLDVFFAFGFSFFQ